MNKKVIAFLLSLMLLMAIPMAAYADTVDPSVGSFSVWFDTTNTVRSDFTAADVDSIIDGLQPGDDTDITITVRNQSGKTIDWYMKNIIVRSLESRKASARNGGYTYILTYRTSGDVVREFYNSAKVGGGGQDNAVGGEEKESQTSKDAPEGLLEIKDSLSEYMFLETMATGRSGVLRLHVELEGESQDNSYQDTEGKLQFQFACEIVPTRTVVKTGDEGTELKPIYIGMAAAGMLVLGLAIDGAVQNKKKRSHKA